MVLGVETMLYVRQNRYNILPVSCGVFSWRSYHGWNYGTILYLVFLFLLPVLHMNLSYESQTTVELSPYQALYELYYQTSRLLSMHVKHEQLSWPVANGFLKVQAAAFSRKRNSACHSIAGRESDAVAVRLGYKNFLFINVLKVLVVHA